MKENYFTFSLGALTLASGRYWPGTTPQRCAGVVGLGQAGSVAGREVRSSPLPRDITQSVPAHGRATQASLIFQFLKGPQNKGSFSGFLPALSWAPCGLDGSGRAVGGCSCLLPPLEQPWARGLASLPPTDPRLALSRERGDLPTPARCRSACCPWRDGLCPPKLNLPWRWSGLSQLRLLAELSGRSAVATCRSPALSTPRAGPCPLLHTGGTRGRAG